MLGHVILEYLEYFASIVATTLIAIAVIADFLPWHDRDDTMTKRKVVILRFKRPTRAIRGIAGAPRTRGRTTSRNA
jgi:hypothetical protein